VLGIVEKGSPKIILHLVSDRTTQTLRSHILRHVSTQAAAVYTDDWRSYRFLRGHGYQHCVVKHIHHFVNPNNRNCHTNTIEGRWSLMRKKMRTMNHVRIQEETETLLRELWWRLEIKHLNARLNKLIHILNRYY
jgi:IS1 family transposase